MVREQKPLRHGWIRVAVLVVLLGCLAISAISLAGAAGEPEDPKNVARKSQLAHYGGGAMLAAARALEVEELMGKPVNVRVDEPGPDPGSKTGASFLGAPSHADPRTDEPPESANNSAIRYFPNTGENEPSVAVNPRHPERIVVGTHFGASSPGNRCVAHYSRDGGRTWNPIPIFMRQLSHQATCSDPVLAYAPDGSRVYYAYMDIDFASTFKIVVSYSDDDGRSWKGPFVALSDPAADYDKPWIGTHVAASFFQSNRNWVYVTATRFDFAGACHIDFARSSNKGTAWSAPVTLDTSGGSCGTGVNPVVQGSRPNGGLNNDVIVAWYNSGTDGWLEGSFNIRTRHSSNNGASFGPIVVAATENFELPFWLGPNASYHRIWGGMFPDVEIAPNGTGHLAYISDPVANPGGFSTTAEDGDVRYTTSGSAPFATWAAPVTVSDDVSGKAQGWVALEADSVFGQTILSAIWEDHRTSTLDNFNYDVFSSTSTGSWSPNTKVTDATSTSDFVFVGDYYDITVAQDFFRTKFFGVWTDRRDEPDIFDLDDDIWGARIEDDDGHH